MDDKCIPRQGKESHIRTSSKVDKERCPAIPGADHGDTRSIDPYVRSLLSARDWWRSTDSRIAHAYSGFPQRQALSIHQPQLHQAWCSEIPRFEPKEEEPILHLHFGQCTQGQRHCAPAYGPESRLTRLAEQARGISEVTCSCYTIWKYIEADSRQQAQITACA